MYALSDEVKFDGPILEGVLSKVYICRPRHYLKRSCKGKKIECLKVQITREELAGKRKAVVCKRTADL